MFVKSLEPLLHLVLPHISAQDMSLLRTWAGFGLLSVRSHFCGVRVKTASPILQSICAHVTTSVGLHWSTWNLILSGLINLFTFPYFDWNLSTMLYTLYRYVHASSGGNYWAGNPQPRNSHVGQSSLMTSHIHTGARHLFNAQDTWRQKTPGSLVSFKKSKMKF
jgi:hypothetical protein